jgi:hypothetical protein
MVIKFWALKTYCAADNTVCALIRVPSHRPVPTPGITVCIKTIDGKLWAVAVCPLTILNCLEDIDVDDIKSFTKKLLPQSFFLNGHISYHRNNNN